MSVLGYECLPKFIVVDALLLLGASHSHGRSPRRIPFLRWVFTRTAGQPQRLNCFKGVNRGDLLLIFSPLVQLSGVACGWGQQAARVPAGE